MFPTLLSASSTTISATSESNALFKFLFCYFETPYLNIFGMLSIPLFISRLPKDELRALEPISKPSFARFSPAPFPDCLLLLLFLILWRTGSDLLNLTCIFRVIFWILSMSSKERIPLFFLLGPIFLTFFTLMFLGSYFLLILSYLAVKAIPFDRVTTLGTARFLNTILSLILAFCFFVYDLYRISFVILV